MSDILVIDSYNSEPDDPQVIHLRNSIALANALGADLVTDGKKIRSLKGNEYRTIIFVHAAPYGNSRGIGKFCAEQEYAKLYYVTNEYNLGEPAALWFLCKEYDVKYEVIANHDASISKIVGKYVSKWNVVNVNALSFFDEIPERQPELFEWQPEDPVYYGTFRSGRTKYFMKYFDKRLAVSCSPRAHASFRQMLLPARYIGPIKWSGTQNRLNNFKASLYIEDEITHSNYNFMANRFYEALGSRVPTLFDASCLHTIYRSGYHIPEQNIIQNAEQLHRKIKGPLDNEWMNEARNQAQQERMQAIEEIKQIIQ